MRLAGVNMSLQFSFRKNQKLFMSSKLMIRPVSRLIGTGDLNQNEKVENGLIWIRWM